jgi:hypothetical protein
MEEAEQPLARTTARVPLVKRETAYPEPIPENFGTQTRWLRGKPGGHFLHAFIQDRHCLHDGGPRVRGRGHSGRREMEQSGFRRIPATPQDQEKTGGKTNPPELVPIVMTCYDIPV